MEGLWEDDMKAFRCTTDQALTSASTTHVTFFHPPYDFHINTIIPSWVIRHKMHFPVKKVPTLFFLLLKQPFPVGYVSHSF